MLHRLCNKDYNPIHGHCHNTLNPSIGSKNSFYYKEYGLDGSIEYTFVIDLINIIDKVFVNNNERYASIEQRKLLRKYCKEADTELTTELVKQLDNYLCGYLGEENDVYFTKQFCSQR